MRLYLFVYNEDILSLHANDLVGDIPDGLCELVESSQMQAIQADCGGD